MERRFGAPTEVLTVMRRENRKDILGIIAGVLILIATFILKFDTNSHGNTIKTILLIAGPFISILSLITFCIRKSTEGSIKDNFLSIESDRLRGIASSAPTKAGIPFTILLSDVLDVSVIKNGVSIQGKGVSYNCYIDSPDIAALEIKERLAAGKTQPKNTKRCPKCGRELAEDVEFCGSCGYKL